MANSCFFTFSTVHPMLDQVLGLAESDRIAIRLYSLAMNLNTNKPIDIRSTPNINK
jgi:hypothetical protein